MLGGANELPLFPGRLDVGGELCEEVPRRLKAADSLAEKGESLEALSTPPDSAENLDSSNWGTKVSRGAALLPGSHFVEGAGHNSP